MAFLSIPSFVGMAKTVILSRSQAEIERRLQARIQILQDLAAEVSE